MPLKFGILTKVLIFSFSSVAIVLIAPLQTWNYGKYESNEMSQQNEIPRTLSLGPRKPDCRLLFQDSKAELEYTKDYIQSGHRRIRTDEEFVERTKYCDAFKVNYSTVVSNEERHFPLAFGIRMHRNVAQTEQLLRAIYRPHNIYCIYVDLKANATVHRAIKGIASCFDNVFVAKKLSVFVYKSFSPVKADLQCMEDVFRSTVDWKYFINVAGSEFPLKTNLEMVKILTLLNGTNDVEQILMPNRFNERWVYAYQTLGDDYIRTNRRNPLPPFNVTLMKGSSYNLLSRDFVQWILTNSTAHAFIQWAKDTHSPDEMIWATLNSISGAPGGYPNHTSQVSKTVLSREVIWSWSAAYCTGQLFVHSICILTSSDLSYLARRWEFFANKFDNQVDPVVLDCLEERLGNISISPSETTINWSMVHRMPHVGQAMRRQNLSHIVSL